MDFDFDSLSKEDEALFHQKLIQFGEALQKSPRIRCRLLDFLKAFMPYLTALPTEVMQPYADGIVAELPDPSAENHLRKQVATLEEIFRWLTYLGISRSFDWDLDHQVGSPSNN
jgi:hypothetical protein